MITLTKELENLMPRCDSAKDAIEGLHATMDAATKATISLIEIGIQEIGGGRYGPPTAEDEAQLNKLRALLMRLKRGNN